MARITSPEAAFTGDLAGVHFVKGVAETDDPAVIGYCQGAGYDVQFGAATDEPETAPAGPVETKGGRAAGKGATGAQD